MQGNINYSINIYLCFQHTEEKYSLRDRPKGTILVAAKAQRQKKNDKKNGM